MLSEEANQLKNEVAKAKTRLKVAPAGNLRISKRKNGVEYYYKNEQTEIDGKKNKNGRYIKQKEFPLVKALAQRDYDLEFVKCGQRRIEAIDKFLRIYGEKGVGEVYEKLNDYRKSLVIPGQISDEMFVRQWEQKPYVGKSFSEEEMEIITERNERVRSKSEKIIADKLLALKIPYRYECPIILQGNIVVYPDFTILRVATREEVYLEHFGRMDDAEYVEKVMSKLALYEKCGIQLGVNLFVTFETGKRPLNTRALDKLLRKLFCEE